MSIFIQSPRCEFYPVQKGSIVTATVIIGDANAGGWTILLDKPLKGSHANPNPIGDGGGLKGRILQVATTVVDTNPATNRLSTVLRLSGGAKGDVDILQTLDASEGDSAVFTTLVLFT